MTPSAAQDENLLANPGFEMLTPDGTPEDWDLFVMPMEGAMGRVSSEAHSGERSVSLFTPLPYPVEPANNWSQVVYGEFGGESIQATVFVRTEDVGGAALWIQCFQRSPVRVLATGSSSIEYGLTGTNDWTEVTATIEAPVATSYVVLRCVLQGTGRAWFDTASLTLRAADAGFEADVEPEPAPEATPSMAQEFEVIREQMQSALATLHESNDMLRSEIGELQSELSELRSELQEQPKSGVEEPLSPAISDDLERTRDEIQSTLADQTAANEALRDELSEVETQLDRLETRVKQEPPTIAVTAPAPEPTAAPDAAEDFARLRSEVEAAIESRDEADEDMRDAIEDIRTQLNNVTDRLAELSTPEDVAPEAGPRRVLADELDALREQMQMVLNSRNSSDDAFSDELARLSGQLRDIEIQLDSLQAPAEPRIASAGPEGMVQQFEVLRQQIQSTLDEVQAANEQLRGRIGGLQSELRDLRVQLEQAEAAAEEIEPPAVRHILVPREPGGEQ